ncbi:MAG TPA: Gfo/Idh/MocA family oxidoreductase [Terriglobales bacterium]|nr:Gfo/Idh/MocA family oxidoreductase [Terriglobales bacterium]
MAKLGVGVVGAGRMGRCHAENLRSRIPEAKLIAVADVDLEAARRLAADLEIEHSYPSVEALVERKDIDAVVIASPSKFHLAAVETAAAARKHILCEKPLAMTLEGVDAAIAAARKSHIVLQVGFMRRYDPAYSEAHRRIEAGEIGTPIIFKAIGRDREPPPLSFYKSGSGTLFLDSTIHEFDLARWLMRDEVLEVHAFGGMLANPEIAKLGELDAGIVNLRFEGGAIGNVESFRQSRYGYDIFTEVVGSKATLRIGYLRQTALSVLTADGVSHDVVDHFLVRFADAYLNEVRDFVQRILAEKPASVTGEDARKALAIALAADASQRQSRSVLVPPQMQTEMANSR